MPNLIKPLVRSQLDTNTSTVLYTTPSSTTAVATSIIISNISSSDATVTISLNDVLIMNSVNVTANSIVSIDLKQALEAGQTIKGGASANTSINLHITGVEIS